MIEEQGRNHPGAGAGPDDDADDGDLTGAAAGEATRVITMICETCGKDYSFENEQPPAAIKCEKCGGTVFRAFHDSVGDEAADDFRDSTARDLNPDDAEGDTLPGDILDLNRL